MNPLATHLNKQLANCSLLYVKLQNYHWYVKGEHFFTLHEKFQALYEELPPAIDEIAERILTIGENPAGTMKQYLELASIQEASGQENAAGMAAQLERDYRMLAQEMQQGVDIAEQTGDVVTADLFTGLAASFDKQAWLLRSYLAQAVQQTS